MTFENETKFVKTITPRVDPQITAVALENFVLPFQVADHFVANGAVLCVCV